MPFHRYYIQLNSSLPYINLRRRFIISLIIRRPLSSALSSSFISRRPILPSTSFQIVTVLKLTTIFVSLFSCIHPRSQRSRSFRRSSVSISSLVRTICINTTLHCALNSPSTLCHLYRITENFPKFCFVELR